MIIFDFIYFSIYTLIPDKAILGKRDGSCTLFSSFTALFLSLFFMDCMLIFNFRINSITLLITIIILFGGLFILARIIYLKPAKFRNMYRKFRKIPKWLLKTNAIMYLLLCVYVPMGLHIFYCRLS